MPKGLGPFVIDFRGSISRLEFPKALFLKKVRKRKEKIPKLEL